jgi:hypothetical protein
MHKNPIYMRLLIVFLIPMCSFTAVFSQENPKKVVFGVGLHAVLSDLYDNGLAPLLTVDVKKHQFFIGPRITFFRMNVPEYKSYKARFNRTNQVILNAGYRYFPLKKRKWFNPNLQINLEYERAFYQHTAYYDHTQIMSNGPVFDHSFNLETKSYYSYWNIYGGMGLDISLWKELYLSINGGLGAGIHSYKMIYTNTDTNELEAEYKTERYHLYGLEKMATIGLGYRF